MDMEMSVAASMRDKIERIAALETDLAALSEENKQLQRNLEGAAENSEIQGRHYRAIERGLRDKLQRVRDAIKFAANSQGGLVAEIDAALAQAEQPKDCEKRGGSHVFLPKTGLDARGAHPCTLCGTPYPEPAPTPAEPSDTEMLKDMLRLVLAFYDAGHWTPEQRAYWKKQTGKDEATTRVLCDEIRIRLGVLPSAFGDFMGRLPSALPPDLSLTKEQEEIVWRMEADTLDAAMAEEKT